jgi:exopolyphosphatase/guanosine-5'-triphosphate,3'-diphosphate pyrophosphatase
VRHLQVIDVGTNSVRSIIVEVPVGGPYRVIDDEKEMTRLGEGMQSSGLLSEDAMERTAAAIGTMWHIGRRLRVDQVRAIGTEALRRASNAPGFLERIHDDLGLDVEVVAPEEEGRLVWLSASGLSKGTGFDVAIDIGGGSVEVIQAVDSEPVAIASMRLGARVLAERFVREDPISDEGFRKLKRHVRHALRAKVTPLASVASPLIGSGGTINSIASIVAARRGRRYDSLHGVEIGRADVMRLLGVLTHSSTEERLKLPGMPVDRVDIIVPGAVVLAEVLKLFGAPGLVINARGIREGIVVDTLAREGAADVKPDLMRSVRDLGVRYHFDRDHAKHVTLLALSIFDQVSGALGIDPGTRPLLEAAAMLHDIGYYIAYDRHHEHTYHLVVHSTLPGLTRREQEMIAAIARYHTKSLPKSRHVAWASLEPADRPTVGALAAILRLADGLDRGHAARVHEVGVIVERDRVRLILTGEADLYAEMHGVDKKRDLFESLFGRRVIVETETPQPSPADAPLSGDDE